MAIDYTKLREPFASDDVEWRIQKAGINNNKAWGIVLAYVTNRAIQQRLDAVAGAANWQNEYTNAPEGGVLCGISIYENDRWVTKYDGAENTAVEKVKGGLSSAMKRAAVQWGIGRYLYDVKTVFVTMIKEKPQDDGQEWHNHYDKDSKTNYYWTNPTMPDWALPDDEAELALKDFKVTIHDLAIAQGTPQQMVDDRLSEIVTIQEARIALKKLQGRM